MCIIHEVHQTSNLMPLLVGHEYNVATEIPNGAFVRKGLFQVQYTWRY